MKKITIKIKDLNIKTDFQGFEGKQCDIEAEDINKVMEKQGIRIDLLNKEYKPEYFMLETEKDEEEFKETNENSM